MSVCSVTFLVCVLAVSAVIYHIPWVVGRQILLGLFGLVFLWTWVPNVQSAVGLCAFTGSGYLTAVVVRSISSERARRGVLAGYFSALLVCFLILKKYEFLEPLLPGWLWQHSVLIVGLSYMLFRQIHFVVDSAQGQIEQLSLWSYLNYQLNPFGLLAGPIARYQPFHQHWMILEPITTDRHEQLKIYARLLIGVLKVLWVGSFFLYLSQRSTSMAMYVSRPRDIVKFAAFFYSYPAYIFFNFSGYCDVVIAAAALVGLDFPENFNQPYLARNLLEFWTRWHMTLTTWIRDYIFTPLYKSAVERWPRQARPASYVCYFIALFLAGIWHGSSLNFAVFGLLHGAGVSTNKWWEERMIAKRKRSGLKEYLKSRPIRWLATFATFNFVCFTLLFFPADLRGRVHFLQRFLHRPPAGMTEDTVEAQ